MSDYPIQTQGSGDARVISLDQFRGYTVLGMCVVNFLSFFAAAPAVLKHHNTYCSYADTIMPQFFFAVGFAYRLTWLRAVANADGCGISARFWRRNLRLILFGAMLYLAEAAIGDLTSSHPPGATAFLARVWQEDLFQTLVHIGVTALWILPVIGAGTGMRLAFALGSAGLHVGLSHWFYYERVTAVGIDGGPLGFLTWTIPMIAGSLAHDFLVKSAGARAAVRRLLGWGCGLMVLGYGLSCLNLVTPPNTPAPVGFSACLIEPPFMPPTHPVNLWTMSQRAGSVSYLTFGAGFSLALYALFVWACDVRRWQVGMWRTFGTNALAAYIIIIVMDGFFQHFKTKGAALWLVLAELLLFVGVCYAAVRALERKRIYWRL